MLKTGHLTSIDLRHLKETSRQGAGTARRIPGDLADSDPQLAGQAALEVLDAQAPAITAELQSDVSTSQSV